MPDPLAGLVTPDTGRGADAPIEFAADTGVLSEDLAALEGNVEVRQGDRHLEAARVSVDRQNEVIFAEEGVTYGDPRLALRSERAELDLANQVGIFAQGEYYLPERNARGGARRVITNRETRRTRFDRATYTTCERGTPFWQLRTRTLETDEKRQRGTARNVTLAIRNVPVFYFPYLSFPISDERQSGFLLPRLGLDSRSGFDFQLPYYWNIAPNMDATFAPRVLTKRGLMLAGEYRFLFPRHSGEVDLEFLPEDQEFGESRGSFNVRHRSHFLPRLFSDLRFEYVSDDEYLDDFGEQIDLLTETYLQRYLNVTYFGNGWTALARAQGFQTLEEDIFTGDNEPYDRLPQLRFDGAWPRRFYGLGAALHSELVNFDRDSGVTGLRFDVQPSIELPLERPWGYLKPRLSYRYTAYSLEDAEAGQPDSPDRGAPIVSVDSGLFFERPFQWRRYDGIQTLEPRLFYLYVPFRDQDDFPLFDTAEIDRSFPWLFLENRFTGADRLGDANQLTAALTSRLIDAGTSREWFRFSIGQIYYFEDREVVLEGILPENDNRSEVIAETLLNLNTFSIRNEMQFNLVDSGLRRAIVDLRYHPGEGRLANFAYRFARDELEQVDVTGIWPFGAHWRTFARWNYSLKDAKNLETFAGFEYQECCWAVRLLLRNHRTDPEEEADNSIVLELELKGLGATGRDVEDRLQEAVLGYETGSYYRP